MNGLIYRHHIYRHHNIDKYFLLLNKTKQTERNYKIAKNFQHTILLDFDGTCVTHDYPEVGKRHWCNSSAKENRCWRSSSDFTHDALWTIIYSKSAQWFQSNQIPLFAVNENPEQKSWTNSPKVYGSAHIDDVSCWDLWKWDTLKLLLPWRPFVDWVKMEYELIKRGIPPRRVSRSRWRWVKLKWLTTSTKNTASTFLSSN